MNIFLILSGVFFGILAVGFLVGFFRGWCKSLIRLGITIFNLLIALLVSPLITGLFTSKVADGSEISIFSLSINIADIFKDFVGNDITLSQNTTNLLTASLTAIIVNLLLYIIIFLVLQFISLIVYLIIVLILFLKKGDEDEEEIVTTETSDELQNESKTQNIVPIQNDLKPSQHIGLRLLGGFEGLVGAIALLFVILVPCFGFMNIMDKTLIGSPKNDTVQTASAVSLNKSLNSFICGELFYDNNENMDTINEYIGNYAKLKAKYNSTFMGKFLKYTGINKLGILAFNNLTNVSIAGNEVSLTNETAAVIDTFNSLKYSSTDFDFADIETVNAFKEIYTNASRSLFIQRYAEDLIPVWAEKWTNGEKFFGFNNPAPAEYKETINHLLKVFSSSTSFSRINLNVEILFDAYKVINEHEIIKQINNGTNFIDILSNDKTIIKQLLETLAVTAEFKNHLPNALNSALSIVYDSVIGDDKFIPTLSETQTVEILWTEECVIIQNIVNELLLTYENVSNSDNSTLNLEQFGKVLDTSKTSQILSDSLKSFFICFVESEKVELDTILKTNLIDLINTKWSELNYSFEKAFSTITETSKVVESVINNLNSTTANQIENIDFSNLSSTIEYIINDDYSKTLILNIAKDENLVKDYIGDSAVATTFTDILTSFIENTSTETLSQDIEAMNSVINIIGTNSDFDNLDSTTCDKFIENIGNSETMINIIDDLTSNENNSNLQTLVSDIGSDNLSTLSESIASSQLSEEQKNILNKLFEI